MKFTDAKWFLKDKKVSMSLKRRHFNSIIIPTLAYGSEVWACTKVDLVKLRSCQRKMERKMVGVTLWQKKRSSWIRSVTKVKDIIMHITTLKFNHARKILARKEEDRWDTRLLDWTPQGKRNVGRPRMRWEDDLRKSCGPNWTRDGENIDWKEAIETSIERNAL